MIAFKSHRVTHEYTQTNLATPERVFPLLCPVREAEWVPDWQYRLIYSESGVAEKVHFHNSQSTCFQPSGPGCPGDILDRD